MARGTHAHRHPWLRLALTFVLALGMLASLPPGTVRADTFTVLNGDDDGPGSLWQTILDAPAGSTINFAPAVTTVTLITAPITLFKDVIIQGNGVGGVTVERSNADSIPLFSVFTVDAGVVATMQGLTIRNGSTSGLGGGVRNEGGSLTLIDSIVTGNTASVSGGGFANLGTSATLTLTNSTISGNTASIGGGGLYNEGTATLTDSTISGNTVTNSTGLGGGIYNNGGATTAALTVTSSTISGNSAAGGGGASGGGLYNQSATATLTNSTISGNAANNGGGLYNDRGTATLNAVTLVGNSATGFGGGVVAFGQSGAVADTTFGRSIVAGNTSPNAADCSTESVDFAPLSTTGYNIVGAGSDCPATGTGDDTYAGALGALLNPTLADNGGPTQTHALVFGSPALDHVATAQCGVAADQRGVARAQGAACDSGAYEARTFTLTTATSGPGTISPPPGSYLEGSVVAVSGIPNAGAAFGNWLLDGNPAGNTTPLDVPMTANRIVIANFAFNLTVTTSGTGSVDRDLAGGGGGPFSYFPGTVVNLTPQPGVGQTFVGWTVDGVFVGWAKPLGLAMNANRTVQATFASTKTFPDVGSGRADFTAITELASRTTIRGYANGSYGPDDGVQRAQMAALIARATSAGPGTPPTTLVPPACLAGGTWDCEDWGNGFSDRNGLDANLWRNVGALQHYGVAFGYDGAACAARGVASPCYAPNAPVSYVETVVFITRAMIAKGYWVAQPNAPQPYAGVPAVFAPTVATYHYYTGGVPAPPSDWNAGATRGWFARALWQALNTYWATDGNLPDGRPAGGFVP